MIGFYAGYTRSPNTVYLQSQRQHKQCNLMGKIKQKKRNKSKTLFHQSPRLQQLFSLLHMPHLCLKNHYHSPTSWMPQTFPCLAPSYLRTNAPITQTQLNPCSIVRIWIMKPPKTTTPTTIILTILPASFRRTLQWSPTCPNATFQTWIMRTWSTLQRSTIVPLAIFQTPPSKIRTPNGTSGSTSLTWISSYFRVLNTFNFSENS